MDADIDDEPTNFNNTNRQNNNGNPRIINAGTTSISLSGADLENFLGSLTGQSNNGGQSNGQGGLGGLGSILSMFGGGNTGGLGMGLNMRQGSSNSNNSNNANTSTTQNQTG